MLAETFVAMPFFVLTMEGALRSVDRRLEDAARTLGASRWTVFRRVTLPLDSARRCRRARSSPGRARSASSAPPSPSPATSRDGRRRLPLAVYLALETKPEAAFVLSLVLLAVSLAVLIGLRRRWLAW